MKPRFNLREALFVLLFPLSMAWAFFTKSRRRLYPACRKKRSRLPVLCVGNIHSGGSGKTPLVIALAERLKGLNPAVLSRGYGGSLTEKGGWVDPARPDLFGDEPCLIAQCSSSPVYVSRDRVRGAQEIEKRGESQLIVMDDGFQHLRLERDVDLVVIGAHHVPEQSFCLPYGELREPFSAIRFASAVLLTAGRNDSTESWRKWLGAFSPEIPLFEAKRVVLGVWEGKEEVREVPASVAAFCGIANPGRFAADLASVPQSVLIAEFPDHHRYSAADLERLITQRKTAGASCLLTTEKDAVKVRAPLLQWGERVLTLRIGYDIPEEFWYFLEKRLEP